MIMTSIQTDLYNPYYGDELYALYVERRNKTPMFATPQELRDVFDAYVQWCRNHPIIVKEYVRSGIAAGHCYLVERKHMVTEFGFTQYIGANCNFLHDRLKFCEGVYEKYQDEESAALIEEITTIRKWIRDDMDKSACVGQLDANYVAKLRGLRDIKDVTSAGAAISGGLKVEVFGAETANNVRKIKNLARKREEPQHDEKDVTS